MNKPKSDFSFGFAAREEVCETLERNGFSIAPEALPTPEELLTCLASAYRSVRAEEDAIVSSFMGCENLESDYLIEDYTEPLQKIQRILVSQIQTIKKGRDVPYSENLNDFEKIQADTNARQTYSNILTMCLDTIARNLPPRDWQEPIINLIEKKQTEIEAQAKLRVVPSCPADISAKDDKGPNAAARPPIRSGRPQLQLVPGTGSARSGG